MHRVGSNGSTNARLGVTILLSLLGHYLAFAFAPLIVSSAASGSYSHRISMRISSSVGELPETQLTAKYSQISHEKASKRPENIKDAQNKRIKERNERPLGKRAGEIKPNSDNVSKESQESKESFQRLEEVNTSQHQLLTTKAPDSLKSHEKPLITARKSETKQGRDVVSDNNNSNASLNDVSPNEPKVVDKSSPITAPKPSYVLGSANNPKPAYPLIAARRGWQGDVVLGVNVASDGSIDNLVIIKGSHYSMLNHAAWETVKEKWSFEPAKLRGQVVASYVEVPISFRLTN